MSGEDTPERPKPKGRTREDRLKQALKANLARRKAQARQRGQDKANRGPDTGSGQDKG